MSTRKPTPYKAAKPPQAQATQPALQVEALKHPSNTRKNIPTAELQSVVSPAQEASVQVRYPRNPDLDPQLVWRGKEQADASSLLVNAPPIYIQEKVKPKVLIDDLKRQSDKARAAQAQMQAGHVADLFADMAQDFNGLPAGEAKTEFYQHDGHWNNRMVLGDSLQVMASLAEREGLRGKVQCIYFDPPYGIKFNSNFQWSTTSRDVKDGNPDHITREPEMVKAFRDTWRDGIHSYLAYIRDRLTVARDLLSESGSIFVQIGVENTHRVRALLDEVFGEDNFLSQIEFTKSSVGLQASNRVAQISDTITWYAKDVNRGKFRRLLEGKGDGYDPQYSTLLIDDGTTRPLTSEQRESFPSGIDLQNLIQPDNLTKPGPGAKYPVYFRGREFLAGNRWWGTTADNMKRLIRAGRVVQSGNSIRYARRFVDTRYGQLSNLWLGFLGQTNPSYVVQTNVDVVQRCLLMATDPGDLVLDPTCGSGTTAYVAEQWGRRWITIDTSRVALALARARIMGARYPFYLLADSPEGQAKEADVTRSAAKTTPTHGNVRQGFVYERVPHITLKSIANNAEIDVIWNEWQSTLEPLRAQINKALKTDWQEWEIPREAQEKWSDKTTQLHADWWAARIARQQAIDASIAAKAEFEFLYDRPYEDKKKVRVAGTFTVESLLPHRVLGVDENDALIDPAEQAAHQAEGSYARDFAQIILENLKTAGVQQAHKADKIDFTALNAWPGEWVCAEGRYMEGGEGGVEKRAAIFIGPEFGTVSRPDLVKAAREAGDAGFDVLIACAFNFDAHSTDFNKLGRLPVLKARMNADLHMAEDLKNTGKGNLFVIFGEPDIDILSAPDGQVKVKVNGVDVFHPNSGEIRSHGADGIACWFIDTDYNEESFFVRHAYFLGASDPYKSLKTTLKADINAEAWESLHSDTSRAFDKPTSGRIAVKVINHLGDEVMKVFRV
jgi:adenine-specific DNA-methyltransferase